VFKLSLAFKGVYALAHDKRHRPIIADIIKSCQVQAFADYVEGRMRPTLRDRFKHSAFAAYGFKERSEKYIKQQLKKLGDELPYVSPRSLNFLRAAKALTRGSVGGLIAAVRDLAYVQPHMRTLVFRRGSGFNITPSGKNRVVTRLTVPGARILNRNPKSAIYREQFLDLNLGGARDARAILKRFNQLFEERIVKAIGHIPKVELRAA
jgi:hypothetical protein